MNFGQHNLATSTPIIPIHLGWDDLPSKSETLTPLPVSHLASICSWRPILILMFTGRPDPVVYWLSNIYSWLCCGFFQGPVDQQLNELGIVLNEVTSPDPRLLSLKRLRVPRIPTHYIILQSGSIPLHLVVFYRRFTRHISTNPGFSSEYTRNLLLFSKMR